MVEGAPVEVRNKIKLLECEIDILELEMFYSAAGISLEANPSYEGGIDYAMLLQRSDNEEIIAVIKEMQDEREAESQPKPAT